jgi:hypothetical protein
MTQAVFFTGLIGVFFGLLIFWSIIWKGLGLWKAVKDNSKTWFIIMLVFNTVGIFEILYIFYFSKKDIFSKSDAFLDSKFAKAKGKMKEEGVYEGTVEEEEDADSDSEEKEN